VVLQILRLTESALDLGTRFIHCLYPAEPPLEVGDQLQQASHLLWLTCYSIHRRHRESSACWRGCVDFSTTHPAIKDVGGDSLFNGGARYVIAVSTDGVGLLCYVPGLHPGGSAKPFEHLLTERAGIAEDGVTLDKAQLSGGGLHPVVLAGRVGVAEHSKCELGSKRKQRLVNCEFWQLLNSGCNGVGGVKVWLRRLLSELERLLQMMFCGVVILLQRRWLQRLRCGGRGRVKAGFLGIVRLCALRDAAREGAVNSYSEARTRKVSPRITLSPPYSSKLTL
jgi:hypothetical protein